MPKYREFTAKEVALTACFTALYVVFSFIPMFKLFDVSKVITAAAIIVPIIGIILGPYLGAMSTFLGGVISLYFNPVLFSPLSLVAGVAGAVCASLLYMNKQALCALVYSGLLLLFGLYPSVGPVWVFPLFLWFQVAGFLVLISPLQSAASKSFNSNSNSRLLFAFLITCLTSTLASHIAGTLAYEMITPETTLRTFWTLFAFIYPAERTVITLIAGVVGASLYRVLKSTNLTSLPRNAKSER